MESDPPTLCVIIITVIITAVVITALLGIVYRFIIKPKHHNHHHNTGILNAGNSDISFYEEMTGELVHIEGDMGIIKHPILRKYYTFKLSNKQINLGEKLIFKIVDKTKKTYSLEDVSIISDHDLHIKGKSKK